MRRMRRVNYKLCSLLQYNMQSLIVMRMIFQFMNDKLFCHLIIGTFDFVLDEVNVTFEASVIQQRVLLDIVNDDINENSELFSVTIEPVEGLYPLRVIDSLATVEITDSDSECSKAA